MERCRRDAVKSKGFILVNGHLSAMFCMIQPTIHPIFGFVGFLGGMYSICSYISFALSLFSGWDQVMHFQWSHLILQQASLISKPQAPGDMIVFYSLVTRQRNLIFGSEAHSNLSLSDTHVLKFHNTFWLVLLFILGERIDMLPSSYQLCTGRPNHYWF